MNASRQIPIIIAILILTISSILTNCSKERIEPKENPFSHTIVRDYEVLPATQEVIQCVGLKKYLCASS